MTTEALIASRSISNSEKSDVNKGHDNEAGVREQAANGTLFADIANLPEEKQRNILGERIYPIVEAIQPMQAAEVTGMLLAMDKKRLMRIIASPEALRQQIADAVRVLKDTKRTKPEHAESEDIVKEASSPEQDSKRESQGSQISENKEGQSLSYHDGEREREKDTETDQKGGRGREAQASTNIYCWGIPRDWQYEELYLLAFACGEIISIRLGPASNKPHTYAFVQFRDIQSAAKAIELLHGRQLYDRKLVVKYAHPPRAAGVNRPGVQARNKFSATQGSQEMIHPYIGSHMYMNRPVGPFGASPQRYMPGGPSNVAGAQAGSSQSEALAHHMHGLSLESPYFSGGAGATPSSKFVGVNGRNMKAGPLPSQSRTNVYIGNLPETISEDRLGEIFKRYGNVISTKVIINRLTNRPLGTALVRMQTHEQAQLAIMNLCGTPIEHRRVYCRFANEKQRRFRDNAISTSEDHGNLGLGSGGLSVGAGHMTNLLATSSFGKTSTIYGDYGRSDGVGIGE